MGKTRIQVSEETRDRLKEKGSKGESYDDIIQRLIKKDSSIELADEYKGMSSREIIKKIREEKTIDLEEVEE